MIILKILNKKIILINMIYKKNRALKSKPLYNIAVVLVFFVI